MGQTGVYYVEPTTQVCSAIMCDHTLFVIHTKALVSNVCVWVGHVLVRRQVRLVGAPPLPVPTHLLFLFLSQISVGRTCIHTHTHTHIVTHKYTNTQRGIISLFTVFPLRPVRLEQGHQREHRGSLQEMEEHKVIM